MNRTISLGTICLLFATCAGAPAPAPAATAVENEHLAEARRLLAADDPDAALALTDQLTRAEPDLAAAWLIAGDANLALFRLDRPSLDPAFVLKDAATAFTHVTELTPGDDRGWFGLAQVTMAQRDYDAAAHAASEAARLRNEKKQPPAAIAAAVAIAAQCALQQLTQAREQELRNGTPDSRGFVPIERPTAEAAERAMAFFEAIQPALPGEGYPGAAQVYEQIGQNDNAVLELERGIRSAPECNEVHVAYQDLHVQLGQQRALTGAYARLVRESPKTAILLWYQGRAEVLVADELRNKQDLHPAIAAYEKANAAYARYAAAVPAHQGTAGQWQAICELSIARCACDLGDLPGARQHLFAAAAASPLTTDYDGMEPKLKDSFGSHFAGTVFAIGRALSSGGEGSLQQTLAFYDDVIARCPGKWGFVYNNAALPARDLGVQLARDLDGKTEAQRREALTQAMALWEKSYRYYEEAVRLSPDDPRILNDCGLMLVFHLNRDLDHARELFDRAIQKGQQQLDALPADAGKDERNFLEEATGDAWQNIGVLLSRHKKRPFAEVKPFLEKAVRYYPYQQREAARMLSDEGRAETTASAAAAAGASSNAQGGAAEALAELKKTVEQSAKDGDLDAAMAAIDRASKELSRYAPFQLLRGDYALRYARDARDQQRKGVEFLFADAVDALKKAVELDGEPPAPRQLLAEAQYDSGAFGDAVRTAKDLLLHVQSLGGGKDDELAATHRLLAAAASRALMTAPQAPEAKSLVADARLSFHWLEGHGRLDAAATKDWADLETTANAPSEAVAVYARALQRQPDDQQALAAVVDAALAAGKPQLAIDALQQRTDAAGLWYLGRARFLAAADLRTAGNFDAAVAELDRARECFAQSMQQNATFADSCQQWQAICLGKQGNARLAQKRWDDAEKLLLDALRLRPDQLNQDLGLQETIKIGIITVADHFRAAEDLGRTEAIYSAATELAKDDLDLLNNEGLFARDRGKQLEDEGKAAESKQLYEHSYAAYGRAVQLDPTNVQLRNDTALIAIYHLDRDWEQSRQLLEAAIADGERMLHDMPDDSSDARKMLVSAVGDCWENVALWHLRRDHDFKAAKAAAETALKYPPPQGPRGGARRHLQEAEKALQQTPPKEKQ